MSSTEHDVLAIVASSNPKNSLFIQAGLLNGALEKLYGIRALLFSWSGEARSRVFEFLRLKRPVIVHFGSFDPWLIFFRDIARVHLIYHNHTPLKYYWNWGQKAAALDALTELQLRLLDKSRHWIADSPYNLECLKTLGYTEIDYCPCLISNHFNRINKGCPKTKEPSLIYLGNINPAKNCTELLRIARSVAFQLKAKTILRIVGDIKHGSIYGTLFKETVRRMSDDRYLQIDWINGYVRPDHLEYLLSSSWLYISCSKHEGFGLPACEAILSNTPAIYLECGGQESILNSFGKIPLSSKFLFSNIAADILSDSDKRNSLLVSQQEVAKNYTAPKNYEIIKRVFDPIVLS